MKRVEMSDVIMLIHMHKGEFTMNELAKECCISRRTLYNWLDSFSVERHQILLNAIEKLSKDGEQP